MKGCRPLTMEEIELIHEYFENSIGSEADEKKDLETRNYTLILFGIYSGFRISEILSIKVKDVMKNGKIVDEVYLNKDNTKGKIEGRTARINKRCKKILENHIFHYSLENPETNLFFSSHGGSITSRQAENIIKKVFNALKFTGKLSSHTLRKTFSKFVYELLDRNVLDLQKALGHKNLNSTLSYISFDRPRIDLALDKLEF